MTAKECLRQLRYKNARINAMIERRQRYRELATRSTSVLRGEFSGGRRMNSSCEEYVCKIVDLEREIDQRIDEYVDLTRQIEANIDSLADQRYRELLRWRYINEWSWEKIAQSMHYDRVTVWRLHGKALAELEATGIAGVTGSAAGAPPLHPA